MSRTEKALKMAAVDITDMSYNTEETKAQGVSGEARLFTSGKWNEDFPLCLPEDIEV